MLRFLFISILLISFRFAYSQESNRYHIQQFTTENGLPSNGIKGMAWDEATDFLWIATEAGVARYNGMDFSVFSKLNTPGLSHERMSFIIKNNEDEIYTLDVGENILKVNASLLTGIKLQQLDSVGSFYKQFYLATRGEKVRSKLLSFLQQSKPGYWKFCLQHSDTSVMLLADQLRCLITAGNKDPIVMPFRSGNNVSFVIEGNLFVFDNQKNFQLVNKNFSTTAKVQIIDESGNPLIIESEKNLLFAENGMKNPILISNENAWSLHFVNGKLIAKLICNIVPRNSFIAYAQYSEKNKTLFLGTDSKGIIVISENRVWPMKNTASDISIRNAVYAQIELKNNNVLTNAGQVIGTNPEQAGQLPINGAFDYNIFKSGDSMLWYAQINNKLGSNYLHRYNFKTGSTFVYEKLSVVLSNFAMTEMDGQFYFSFYKGMGRLQGDSLEYLFRPGNNKSQQSPSYAMLEFSPGVIGVGSCDGLILYNIKKRTTDTILKTLGYCYRTLWRYQDYIFIGSYGKGFYIWKNGKIKAMPLDKNNYLRYTHCFIADNNGFCWISSNRGLFKAKLSDLVDAYEQNNSQVYYHYLGQNDGMDITEMNGGCNPCALKLQNGDFSFPTMDGLLWVNPDKSNTLLPEGNIYIDKFTVNKKNITLDSISYRAFPASTKFISIDLAFSAWCNKENIYIEYRINNDTAWEPVDVNNGAVINLTDLHSGKYRLLIRKLNGFGVNNYTYKEINFSIRTSWTSSWWFFALCGLFLFGIISLYLRWRTLQYQIRQKKLEAQVAEKTKELQSQNEILEKNNSIKTRLISIISHDIITPLKFVTVAGKNLLEKKSLMSEALQQETVQEMTNTSQELQLLSTNILNWIKYQNENRRMNKEVFLLYEMVQQIFGILQSLAKQKGLLLVNNVDPEFLVYQYYEPIKILVYNLITNSIHFTEKGTISVDVSKNATTVTLSVKDEGIGMTPDQIERLLADDVVISSANVDNKKGHGLGYLIIKDLLKTINATIKIESIKNEGAVVYISFESATTHLSQS